MWFVLCKNTFPVDHWRQQWSVCGEKSKYHSNRLTFPKRGMQFRAFLSFIQNNTNIFLFPRIGSHTKIYYMHVKTLSRFSMHDIWTDGLYSKKKPKTTAPKKARHIIQTSSIIFIIRKQIKNLCVSCVYLLLIFALYSDECRPLLQHKRTARYLPE